MDDIYYKSYSIPMKLQNIYITTFIWYDTPNQTITFNYPIISPPSPPSYTYTSPTIGFVQLRFQAATNNPYDLLSFTTSGDSKVQYGGIFYYKTDGYSRVLPMISSTGYISTINAKAIWYNGVTNNTKNKYLKTTFYNYSTQLQISSQSSRTVVDINQMSLEDVVRYMTANYSTIQVTNENGSFTNVPLTYKLPFIITFDLSTIFIDFTLTYGTTIVNIPKATKTDVNIQISSNTPVDTNYNFGNIFSTEKYTYIYNENDPSQVYGNLVIYNNSTGIALSAPMSSYGVGNIDNLISQGVGNIKTIFLITNGWSKLWRFNESDIVSFTNIEQYNFGPSSMFSLLDGIGIVSRANVLGYTITQKYINTLNTPITSPLKVSSNVYYFSTDGTKIITSNIQKVSDIGDSTNFSYIQTNTSAQFTFAYYNSNSYIIFSRVGNVSAYNILNGTIIPYVTNDSMNVGSVVSSSFSFMASANTKNLLNFYEQPIYKSYKSIRHNIPNGIYSNNVTLSGNVAYMLPTRGNVAVLFNYDAFTFSYVPFVDNQQPTHYSNGYYFSTSNVYTSSGRITKYTNPNPINNIIDVGRYITIGTKSNIFVFDKQSTIIFSYASSFTANVSALCNSNVYFFSNSNVIQYNYTNPSFKQIFQSLPDSIYTPQIYNGNIYSVSSSNVYMNDYKIVTHSVNSPPIKTLINRSTLLIAFPYTILRINLDTLAVTSNTISDGVIDVTVGYNNKIFITSNTSITRLDDTINETNSLIIPDNTWNSLGKMFTSNYNVFSVTDTHTFVQYNANSLPFYIKQVLSPTTSIYTATVLGSTIYYPPGDTSTNIQLLSPLDFPFYRPSSILNVSTIAGDYRTYLSTDTNLYFIPNKYNSNIITYHGLDTTYQLSGNTRSTVYDGQSIYITPFNDTIIDRLKLFPTPDASFFSNNISFTKTTTINDIIFDGIYAYLVCIDKVYNLNVNNITDADVAFTFQDTKDNIFIDRTYNCGYFDGRYINLVTDKTVVYDTIPLTVPNFIFPSVITEYLHIQPNILNALQTKELRYLVKQIQTVKFTTTGYYKVGFLNLLTEVLLDNKVNKLVLYLNGHERFNCDGDYLQNMQNYMYHSRYPTHSTVSSYSFALHPESSEPSGHLNASRIKDMVFYIDMPSDVTTINMYGTTYNILTIRDGLCGLVFNNAS